MTFFELLGGVALFGILWLFVPRISFVALLWLYFYQQYGFFSLVSSQAKSVLSWGAFFESVAVFVLFAGAILGLIVDLIVIKEVTK